VKRERLAFLADNTHYTERFAFYVGRRCRAATVQEVAKELHLDWHAVKDLEKQYMLAQLVRVGSPGPKAIGIDEISIRKGHDYRIVLSDLIRKRPIWFGGKDRKEASMALFYDWLGEKKARGIRLAVMDMWKPFYNVTVARAPQAAISCTTSSTSCVIWAMRSMRCESPSTEDSAARAEATSRARNTRCFRATRTSR
jgi:transposase